MQLSVIENRKAGDFLFRFKTLDSSAKDKMVKWMEEKYPTVKYIIEEISKGEVKI